MIKKLSYLLLLATFSLLSCKEEKRKSVATEQEPAIETTTVKEVIRVADAAAFQSDLQQRETIQLVDVRTPAEFSEGYIEGATNISFTDPNFQQNVQHLDPSKPVYLYCRSGGRSARASEQLKQLGFSEIIDLDGGITAWKSAQLPVKTEE